MPKLKALTPMMAQYRRIKSELPSESLLLFRLGDFYELFFEDAQLGAEILEVALTKRGKVPMCGIPYHAAGAYLGKLLRAGKKVAVCDQMEEGRPGKLVKRKVTQILSPGAHFDESILQAAQNNYLAAVRRDGKTAAVGTVDLTTGEFSATEVPMAHLPAELDRILPAEIIFPETDAELSQNLSAGSWSLSGYEEWTFGLETVEHALREHFGVASLDGFGFRGRPAAAGVCGAILHYLSHHLRRDLSHLKTPECRERDDHLILDKTTLKNLEVLEPLHRDAPPSASLFGAINETVTPMGARCLRQWISQPLARRDWILRRQEAVETWRKQPQRLEQLRILLKEIKDLERTVSRLSMGSGNARDLLIIKSGLDKTPSLKKILTDSIENSDQSGRALLSIPNESPDGGVLAELNQSIDPLRELSERIDRAIYDQPPATIKEGGMIRDGVDPRLDEWRNAGREGKNWIAELQRNEAERTGIPSLKVRFNSVFGYFIEVTRSHLNKVPERYRRRQTIANGERFTTPELKKVEEKILGAEERARKLEYELFLQIREAVVQHLKPIQKTAAAIAQLDVLASFSETARLHDYCRPTVGEEGQLSIVEGRHPALEHSLIGEPFVPNNAELGGEGPQIALITGPNMAGKSTFVRQTALLALLAHTGSFVPAKSARIDLLDRIFTRIGASDELARGQSTFMVEMSETANILNHATSQSLVVLDEVGRGTSTFDGLSLAWSIVEHLHNRIGAKTLFATHYHELTELSSKLKRLRNFRAVVKEWGDRVVFVRKIVPGGADKSYGIQVARLAGIPKPVIDRAKKILARLEQSDLQTDSQPNNQRLSQANRNALKNLETSPQLDLFSLPT